MGLDLSWKNHNWWLRFPIILFVVASLLDLYFTTRNYLVLPIFPELNPLMKIMPNYWFFLVLNIALTVIMVLAFMNVFNNPKSSIVNKYVIYAVFLLAGVVRLVGAYSNFTWVVSPITDPVVLEQVVHVVETQGTQMYVSLVTNWVLYPFVMLFVVFWLFNKAVKLKEVEGRMESKIS